MKILTQVWDCAEDFPSEKKVDSAQQFPVQT